MSNQGSSSPVAGGPNRFRKSDLLSFAEQAIGRVGASGATAKAVALSLVEADARGVGTHGIVRLPSYRHQVELGEIDPAAGPSVTRSKGASAFVDGAQAFGAVTANFSMDLALERAAEHGVGVAVARRCAHFGAAAHYALRAARAGYVALAASNTPAVMAPYGGSSAAIGNNPFALGAPHADNREPLVLDMAQSVVARGRIKLAEMAGETIPEQWAIAPDGRPTSDPTAALAGALLASGGYKGYGIALTVEILTSVLSGSLLSPELLNTSMTGEAIPRPGAVVGNQSQIFLALDPDAFAGRETFTAGLGRLAEAMKSVDPAPGYQEVLMPGEPEERAAAEAATLGIPLADATIALLSDLAETLSLDFPAAIDR
jgi:LDH2 family malate/lactate/ureidoglycolate dehydrogenase